jgi:hypothetical protein
MGAGLKGPHIWAGQTVLGTEKRPDTLIQTGNTFPCRHPEFAVRIHFKIPYGVARESLGRRHIARSAESVDIAEPVILMAKPDTVA